MYSIIPIRATMCVRACIRPANLITIKRHFPSPLIAVPCSHPVPSQFRSIPIPFQNLPSRHHFTPHLLVSSSPRPRVSHVPFLHHLIASYFITHHLTLHPPSSLSPPPHNPSEYCLPNPPLPALAPRLCGPPGLGLSITPPLGALLLPGFPALPGSAKSGFALSTVS